jgi:fibronectin-binding autotransporter adhesin
MPPAANFGSKPSANWPPYNLVDTLFALISKCISGRLVIDQFRCALGMMNRLFAVISGLLVGSTALGAQRTWDGGGNDGDWRTAQNWDGNIFLPIPIAQGDTLVFPAGPTKLVNTNDFGAGTNFTALTFSGDDYIVRGNMIGLTNGISVTHASGGTTLYLPITLRDDQSFTVANAGTILYLNSDIAIGLNTLTFDGAGHCVLIGEITNGRFFGARNTVVKSGPGGLTIFQPTQHDVPTIVNGGILAVEHRMTNSSVTVNAGGTLRGSGKIGGLNGNGGIIQPGGTTPDALECYGDVSLAGATIFRVRLNGTTAGVTYDQLDVRGAVTLGGTLEITAGFSPAVGDRFTIIDNDGTDDTVGTFASLPEGAVFNINGRPFKISYGDRFGGMAAT